MKGRGDSPYAVLVRLLLCSTRSPILGVPRIASVSLARCHKRCQLARNEGLDQRFRCLVDGSFNLEQFFLARWLAVGVWTSIQLVFAHSSPEQSA